MQAHSYRIAKNNRLVSLPPEQLSNEWHASDNCFWIDIQGGCHDALEHYLGDIKVNPILMQLCDDDDPEIARVIPTDEAIFFGLPVSTGADDEPIGYLAALCLPRLLITLHPHNAVFLTRIVDRLGGRLDDLHQRFVVNAQEKMSQRLAFLTVVSAIFLPLTLLAGIYGMNFESMPELGLPYTYPAALGVMVVIAIGMWRYFKRKGWFD